MRHIKRIKIVEVGPRDGLQNETAFIPTDVKVEFINRLSRTGLKTIEATAFVSPKWVPQMSDHQAVLQQIDRAPGVSYPVLVPNLQGFEKALALNVQEIAIFTAASEQFTQKNINCSIEESITRFKPVVAAAHAAGIKIRGYISCAFGCPYKGTVLAQDVVEVALRLHDLGCYEISLGDTIGIGTPSKAQRVVETVEKHINIEHLAGHFHDTYGQALANIYATLQSGLCTFDSAVAGLGGCPYAKGATGNVATEDVLYMLHGLGYITDIDLDQCVGAGEFICQHLGITSRSKVARAIMAKRKSS